MGVPSGHCFQSSSILSLISLNSDMVVRQQLNTVAICAGVRCPRGTLKISRTPAGIGSATTFVAPVTLRRKRPRL